MFTRSGGQSHIHIRDNELLGNRRGAFLLFAHDRWVHGNHVDGNEVGLLLGDVRDSVIDDNTIVNSLDEGIFLAGGINATNNEISWNNIGTDGMGTDLGSGGDGIRIEGYENEIAHNLIGSVDGSGIKLVRLGKCRHSPGGGHPGRPAASTDHRQHPDRTQRVQLADRLGVGRRAGGGVQERRRG